MKYINNNLLVVLQECLNIFGSSSLPGCVTALKMSYAGYGSPLILMYVSFIEDGRNTFKSIADTCNFANCFSTFSIR